MLLLCLYSSRLIIASAHNDLCLILNHTQVIKIAPQFYSVLWKCIFDIEYFILKIFIYRTSTMANLFIYIYGTSIVAYLCRSFFLFPVTQISCMFVSYLNVVHIVYVEHSGRWLALIANKS